MVDVLPFCGLDLEGHLWLAAARSALAEKGPDHLPVLWPQLARRLGRAPLPAGPVEVDDIQADFSAWRLCDVGGLVLLRDAATDDEVLLDLYLHGDIEERTIVLRSLAFLPVSNATVQLLGEIQRTNIVRHYEAGVLDSNLAVRALRTGGDEAGFTRDDFHRLVLKLAFLDLPLRRMYGALGEMKPALSELLMGFATEREAADRTVWKDTYRIIGRAPVAGSVARILGGIENGNDGTRLAATEGLEALGRADLAPYARERLDREPREVIRRILERIGG